jgi:hypothetical protein
MKTCTGNGVTAIRFINFCGRWKWDVSFNLRPLCPTRPPRWREDWVIRRLELEEIRPDNGGSKYLWNVDKLLPDYMVLQPRRQPSSRWRKFICQERTPNVNSTVTVSTELSTL